MSAAALAAPSAPSSPVSEHPGSTVPTNFDVASSPDPPRRTSLKQSHALANIPVVNNNANTISAQDNLEAHKSKKSKTTPTPGQSAAWPQYNMLIIEIDDTDHPQSKWLNKMDTTADIKEFFMPLPRVLGQDVKGFTPLYPTWAVFDGDGLVTYLRSGFHQRYSISQRGESGDWLRWNELRSD